jgi:hypothetical protein
VFWSCPHHLHLTSESILCRPQYQKGSYAASCYPGRHPSVSPYFTLLVRMIVNLCFSVRKMKPMFTGTIRPGHVRPPVTPKPSAPEVDEDASSDTMEDPEDDEEEEQENL